MSPDPALADPEPRQPERVALPIADAAGSPGRERAPSLGAPPAGEGGMDD